MITLPVLSPDRIPFPKPVVNFGAGEGEQVLRMIIPGDPTPKGRPRLGTKNVYNTTRTTQAQDALGWCVRSALGGLRPIETHELIVHINFFSKTHQRRDIDNLAKLVLDACNMILWKDDTQVGELYLRRERGVGDAARTELTVIRGRRLSVDCTTCGKEFVPTSQAGLQRRQKRFCSKPCYDMAQRKGEYRACFTCGKRVYRPPSKLQFATYCSLECKELSKNEKAICRVCQKEFQAFRSQVKRAPFCSVECSGHYHRNKKVKPTYKWRTCTYCGAACSGKSDLARCRACFLAGKGREKVAR